MTAFAPAPHAISVTKGATRGVPSLVSIAHREEISRLEHDLRESVLLLARMATDSGKLYGPGYRDRRLGLDRADV